MISLIPEPKVVHTSGLSTVPIRGISFRTEAIADVSADDTALIIRSRLADFPELIESNTINFKLLVKTGDGGYSEGNALFTEQGYVLNIEHDEAIVYAQSRQGIVNAISTFKAMLVTTDSTNAGCDGWVLPQCSIIDYPSLPVRAVAPTFSWYAGYGRIGFDMQLWGEQEWNAYLEHCLDDKINQLNMVLYGYWPFEMPDFPETVFRDIPMKVWNVETGRFIDVRYSHPNVACEFLSRFIERAHFFGIRVFAYVGLNSYNGGWTIAHPEKRMVPPQNSTFLNDFDSVCLSDEENVSYILASMRRIAELGFDGYTLEESEEGFWFCECDRCHRRWRSEGQTPGEAKHQANIELLHQIRHEVHQINPDAVIGIRAFRQPPLEKDTKWLEETAASLPEDVVLFWAPALYVPPTEFPKWVKAFGAHRIWGRDSEANAITSTMGRLYRTFESNIIRYEDEANVQTIERDIEQHITSVQAGVHGINGYIFEWHGLFLHQWAHGNYGWGSTMPKDQFFRQATANAFGASLGSRVLHVMRSMITIHESQIALYTTPFPFQANVMTEADVPTIKDAIEAHPALLKEIREIRDACKAHKRLQKWVKHFDRLENAQRRNRVIYDMVLAAIAFERAESEDERTRLLEEILRCNEADFAIAKEMFFDLNPVEFTGVKSCMMPYHELKRLIHNIRHPEAPDEAVICSGIEALGWLWLTKES